MKRSQINECLRQAQSFMEAMQFCLPPFATWSPKEWADRAPQTREIRDCRLGWDLTDFGSGNFERVGLLLFTLRNGTVAQEESLKTYAEKVMVVEENQITPWHFHWQKVEDIINRGGGALVIELAWASVDESSLQDRDVDVTCDGVVRTVTARGQVTLEPGESITLPPKLYHQFYAAPGRGRVLVGEVSKTNDDETDNRFLEPVGRFPQIEEDEPAYRLLCNEYPAEV